MSATETKTNSLPSQIKYIVGNEACERFSYYGMRAILVVFMTEYLMKSATDAKVWYHFFTQACYFAPLLGGYLADRYLGKYPTIIILSLVYCLGHATLAMWENETGLLWGLGLIALGSGGIKPCVSAHVGDQFTDKNKHLLERVFSVFYFSINFGAFFSSLLTPILLIKYGPSWAFGVPGILMAIATFIFWMGRKDYIVVPPSGNSGPAGFMTIFLYSLKNSSKKKPGQSFFDVALNKYSLEEVEAAKSAASIFKVFATVTVFWALFDQQGSSWTLQAKDMDLNFMGMQLEASQIQAINPIMVMLLIPIFTYGIYPLIERMGIKVTPLRKMSIGMLLAGISFVMIGMIQVALESGNKLNVMWQMIPYLVITCSEVMVSITGLEFAYTQAPRSMKSTIMSFWLLTVAFGNMLDAVVAKINIFTGPNEFFFFAGLMFLVSIVFVIGAIRYKVRNFIESTEGAGLTAAPSTAT